MDSMADFDEYQDFFFEVLKPLADAGIYICDFPHQANRKGIAIVACLVRSPDNEHHHALLWAAIDEGSTPSEFVNKVKSIQLLFTPKTRKN